MLSKHHQFMLVVAAESKDSEVIDRVIKKVMILSPKDFLQTEQDFKSRVFHHRPFGMHWSGNYVTDKIV
jgi:hypothetical protein